jgi:hypothetical protein
MIKYNKKAEELADFIEANPHCKFDIDNDGWYISEPIKRKKSDLETEMGQEYEENQIADNSDYQWETNWYSGSNLYGAGLAEAMVILLNRRGFKIEASAV